MYRQIVNSIMTTSYRQDPLRESILKIEFVMPSFLTHPYAQVICTNKGELNYVLEWAKQNGKGVDDFYYRVEKFPYYLFLAGDIVGWTDSSNRVGDKFSFREFVDGVNWA